MAIIFYRLVKQSWENRFLFVLAAIISFLILSPLLKGFIGLRSLLNIFLTIIFISSIYAVSQKRHNFLIGTLLVLPMLSDTWIKPFYKSPALSLIGTVFRNTLFCLHGNYHFILCLQTELGLPSMSYMLL